MKPIITELRATARRHSNTEKHGTFVCMGGTNGPEDWQKQLGDTLTAMEAIKADPLKFTDDVIWAGHMYRHQRFQELTKAGIPVAEAERQINEEAEQSGMLEIDRIALKIRSGLEQPIDSAAQALQLIAHPLMTEAVDFLLQRIAGESPKIQHQALKSAIMFTNRRHLDPELRSKIETKLKKALDGVANAG